MKYFTLLAFFTQNSYDIEDSSESLYFKGAGAEVQEQGQESRGWNVDMPQAWGTGRPALATAMP